MTKLLSLFLLGSMFGLAQSFSVGGKSAPGVQNVAPSVVDDAQAVECYIINDEDEEDHIAGAIPEVVCTSAPDEYAWFNGIDRDHLEPTDGIVEGALECVEGASSRGIPEWECKNSGEQAP